jgi:hypothetical protein
VLRTVYGPKGDENKGEWNKVHKKELQNAYSSAERQVTKGTVYKPILNVASFKIF